ncbi:hypothetical protein Areg01_86960 [Actinoplanes regularis]|nr:hypothetical protein Areg01_86960 [Actinoplanes regularis]
MADGPEEFTGEPVMAVAQAGSLAGAADAGAAPKPATSSVVTAAAAACILTGRLMNSPRVAE